MLNILLQFLLALCRTRHFLALENVALRHQLEVLQRNLPGLPQIWTCGIDPGILC